MIIQCEAGSIIVRTLLLGAATLHTQMYLLPKSTPCHKWYHFSHVENAILSAYMTEILKLLG